MAWTNRLTQDTGDEIFWAGNNGAGALRICSWAEGTMTYYWKDVPITTFVPMNCSPMLPAFAPCSVEPVPIIAPASISAGGGGPDWLYNIPNWASILGATRPGNQIWFAWTASANSDPTVAPVYSQAHVEMVELDRSTDFGFIQQVEIYNNDVAFGYPSLATNACTGEIGLSLKYGGGGNYPNHAVGFWGDCVVYPTTHGNVGTDQFGDYVTIRPNYTRGLHGAYFDATGYGLNSTVATKPGQKTMPVADVDVDVHYVVFGRSGVCLGS